MSYFEDSYEAGLTGLFEQKIVPPVRETERECRDKIRIQKAVQEERDNLCIRRIHWWTLLWKQLLLPDDKLSWKWKPVKFSSHAKTVVWAREYEMEY